MKPIVSKKRSAAWNRSTVEWGRRTATRRLVMFGHVAMRAERAVWSVLVSMLWPAVITSMAAIVGVVAWAVLTPSAVLESNLLFSLWLVLFVFVTATVLVGADSESGR